MEFLKLNCINNYLGFIIYFETIIYDGHLLYIINVIMPIYASIIIDIDYYVAFKFNLIYIRYVLFMIDCQFYVKLNTCILT